MNIKKLLAIAIFISLLITGCGNKPSRNVKVAFSVPLGTTYGQDSLHVVEMALNKANGKAGPYNVELMVLSETEPNSESISTPLVVHNAEEAAKDPSVVGWIGPDSSRTAKEIIPILNRASITMISGSNTWPGLTKPGYELGEPGIYYPTGQRTYFRTVASDEVQGAAAARWIQKLGYQKVYIIYGEDVYGKGVAGVFEITAKDIGLGIVGKSGFTTEGELSPALTQNLVTDALNTNPDIIFLAGSVGSNAENVILAIRQANATIPLMGPDGIAVDDILALLEKDQLENIYGTVVAIPPANLDTPAARDFVRSYQNEYGKIPSSYDGAIYEAFNVLLYAIGRAEQPTREAVFASMQNLGEYSGIFGTWHFDLQGDISPSAIGGMKIVDGAWTFLETLK